MLIPGTHVRTALDARLYSVDQLNMATALAHALESGEFVLTAPPAREPWEFTVAVDAPTVCAWCRQPVAGTLVLADERGIFHEECWPDREMDDA